MIEPKKVLFVPGSTSSFGGPSRDDPRIANLFLKKSDYTGGLMLPKIDYLGHVQEKSHAYKYHEKHQSRKVPPFVPPCIDIEGNCSYEKRAYMR